MGKGGPGGSAYILWSNDPMRSIIVTCLLSALTSQAAEFRPTAQHKIVPLDAKVELLWSEGEFTEGPAPAAEGVILF